MSLDGSYHLSNKGFHLERFYAPYGPVRLYVATVASMLTGILQAAL